jgi:hypothetical protein
MNGIIAITWYSMPVSIARVPDERLDMVAMDARKIVVQVQAVKAGDDPPVTVFRLSLTDRGGTWKEAFGSREQLQACLRGMTMMLRNCGYHGHLAWSLPETFHEPSGMRWTCTHGELIEIEELDSDGNILSID